MVIALVGIVRRVIHASSESIVALTSVDLIYPDGRDGGKPLFVDGYEGASALLVKLGVSPTKLEGYRVNFEKNLEVRIPLRANENVVRDMGFNPL